MQQSYVQAAVISAYTTAALRSQGAAAPPVDALADFYEPLDAALQTAFNTWRSQAGIQKGKTQSLKEALNMLPSAARDWAFAVESFHREGTHRYRELFPNGLSAFQRGKQQERIGAVASLVEAIGTEPSLQTLKSTIQTYYATLTATKATQAGAKTETEARSNSVAAAVAAAAAGMFRVYGGLVQEFYQQPARIEDFFDLSLIRDREQTAFTSTVGLGATKFIAKRTLPAGASIRVVNSGAVPLLVFFAETRNAAPPATGGLSVQPGEDSTEAATALGSGPFLHIHNAGTGGPGSYDLLILRGPGGDPGGGTDE